MDVAFLGCCAYLVVETIMLPIAGLRGRDVRGRTVVYVIVLIAAVILGLLVLGRR